MLWRVNGLRHLSSGLFAAALLVTAAACKDDHGVGNTGDVVGGPCDSNSDCAERCLTGGDFPEGICSVACSNDGECPRSTFCIDREGGVCLLGCDHPDDCRTGYTCRGEPNLGHQGDSLVCIAP